MTAIGAHQVAGRLCTCAAADQAGWRESRVERFLEKSMRLARRLGRYDPDVVRAPAIRLSANSPNYLSHWWYATPQGRNPYSRPGLRAAEWTIRIAPTKQTPTG